MTSPYKSLIFVITILLVPVLFDCQVAEAQLPEVETVFVKRIFHNGEHNAFTDMIRFKDRFYLAFRSCPDGHGVSNKASVIILASDDAQTWETVHRFHVKERDTRDPHFLKFKDKLFVYTGTWYYGSDIKKTERFNINQHLGYGVWSENGKSWSDPVPLEGTYGHYIWRAAALGEKAYLCGRRKPGFVELEDQSLKRSIMESVMLESDDGLIWRKKALFQEKNGDETAFLFETDGHVTAVSRRGGDNAELCVSELPYTNWQRTDLGRYIGGPLVAKWGARYIVGGRQRTDNGYVTTLYWLRDTQLHEFVTFPSGGDNSYPGFIALSPQRALISYYSSHEKDENGNSITAIYLAMIEIRDNNN